MNSHRSEVALPPTLWALPPALPPAALAVHLLGAAAACCESQEGLSVSHGSATSGALPLEMDMYRLPRARRMQWVSSSTMHGAPTAIASGCAQRHCVPTSAASRSSMSVSKRPPIGEVNGGACGGGGMSLAAATAFLRSGAAACSDSGDVDGSNGGSGEGLGTCSGPLGGEGGCDGGCDGGYDGGSGSQGGEGGRGGTVGDGGGMAGEGGCVG